MNKLEQLIKYFKEDSDIYMSEEYDSIIKENKDFYIEGKINIKKLKEILNE